MSTEAPAIAQPLTLTKYHGLGNDFLVLLDPSVSPDPPLARLLCDRHRGVGADGLVVGTTLPGRHGEPVLRFRLFNADGSVAEMSGNGLRCLAHAALDAGLVEEGEEAVVDTPVGARQVSIRRCGPRSAWGTTGMGRATLAGAPAACNVDGGALRVGIGNPHLVLAGPDPAGLDVAGVGSALDAAEPGGCNIEFVTLGPGPDELTMRVWERGVGETEACGTGSCAAAVAFHHWGRVGAAVTVHQPGGSVEVRIEADGSIFLQGPSERVAAVTVGA
jgi:diaminopimelate epimerase